MSDRTTNPFESEDATYVILVNAEQQHSLWPDFAAVPAGWDQVFGPDSRQACLEFVEKNWTDITPLSLQAQESRR
ncbi:MbtH family protein [Kribbella italica]|uniref:MbtH protein n=1 Tax=Kribbella italica TaxID=1540520 RepID=A0A7W9J650_9ACTN|nr:MbtH family protein [Kribbella italica]MBB5835618.1 MbtH protein [Kribbella italica]